MVTPLQGWKIHVASDLRSAPDLARVVGPILARGRANLKVCHRMGDVLLLNGGRSGLMQVGKVLTVYPENEAAFEGLVDELDAAWRPRRFPEIVSDLRRRADSAVFFRYGCFSHVRESGIPRLVTPTGSYEEDVRSMDSSQPAWAICPISPTIQTLLSDRTVVIGGVRHWLAAPLKISARGIVAIAIDGELSTVVVKTANLGAGEDRRGFDAVDRLERELLFLKAAAAAGVPCPGLLRQSQCAFSMSDLGSPIDRQRRPPELEILKGAVRAVARLHSAGIVHRDLKPSNVLRTAAGSVLIDFENACHVGEKNLPIVASPPFTSPENNLQPASTADDIYSLGMWLRGIVRDCRQPKGWQSRERSSSSEDDVRARLESLARHATHLQRDRRCTAAEFREALELLTVRRPED